ncbi:MAG: phosphocholine cytidylyltransferase family protein [Methanophagales archaeon]|nr:phosphocholine cytidylyltransferase family protein [Methanophagales archaeon]
MKAIILASGIGKRLRPLTYEVPKPLIKILEDKTILGHQLDNLIGCNIKNIIITTGPFEDKIKMHVKEKYPDLKVSYVNNPKYETTNYIYSIWLTKALIDDDIILLHGDLLFDKKLLEKLINEKNVNCVLVNRKIKAPEKDFKAVIENNRVIKIGVEFYGENVFFSAPLYKFSKSDFLYWLDEIEKFIEKGDTKRYAEDAFNKISNKIMLCPLYFEDELCMEIDTMDDLEMARKIFKV